MEVKGLVSFDVGYTLLEVYPSIGEVYVQVARKYTADEIDPHLVTKSFLKIWYQANKWFDYSKESWQKLVAAVFRGIHPIGSDPNYFEELFLHFAGPAPWRLRPEAITVFKILRSAGYRLVITSNWDLRLRSVLSSLGLLRWFDEIFISAEVGVSKPDVRIYRLISKRTHIPASYIWHIGDGYKEDYWGPKKAGMHPILFDPNGYRPWVRPRVRSLLDVVDLIFSTDRNTLLTR